MKRYFSSLSAMEGSAPRVSAQGNQRTERIESSPQNEATAEIEPPISSNPPLISTPKSNIFDIPASARAQLKEGDIEPDPGKRKPIESLDPDLRDVARRMYINMGPCQPTDHKYKKCLKEILQKKEAFMLIGSRTMAIGWNIVLPKKQPFVSIAFFLSNQEQKLWY